MFNDMEVYAKKNNIPIMLSDGISFLCNYIKDNNVKSILEIGSAIGYSAIRMASMGEDIKVTTIERDIDRYNVAVNNINKYGMVKKINIINGDAMDVLLDDSNRFDLIFIDASKGHNIDFFNKYKKYLNKDGVIITDNLSFHGLVEDESLVKTKNQRGIVRKIKLFIEFLDNNNEFITEYVDVGDRISISKER